MRCQQEAHANDSLSARSGASLRRCRAPAHGTPTKKPNILVIWGDDIGYWNVSAYNQGMMGYKTPNIDRIAKEGALFTDWYGQQSCTAGRAAFITGQSPFRTGLLKVGLPGRQGRAAGAGRHDRRAAQGAGLHDRRSSARTTSATSTSTCPPRTASTSSWARSTT